MKAIISLLIGAVVAWLWLTTAGKKHITETTVITNIVIAVETQVVDRLRWVDVYRTNEIWKTNIVVVKRPRPITIAPSVTPAPAKRVIRRPLRIKPAQRQQPTRKTIGGLRGARPTVKNKISTPGKIKTGVKRDMRGNIK